MRLSLVTEGMIQRSLDELMDWLDASAPAVRDLEIGTGGYSPLGHSPLDLSAVKRRDWQARIVARGFGIAALNVSGNPLQPRAAIGRRHDRDLRRTIDLAAELGVARIIAMSGSPAAGPGPTAAPHFAASAWLPDYHGVRAWQWEQRVRPYWEEINELVARRSPGTTICLELHPGAHVFNVDTFLRLHEAAPRVMVNLDPSHLFWQRMDPLKVIDRLGPLIGHAHAKDVRYNSPELDLNGLLDSRWPGDPATVTWDFAAVGNGDHDAPWWASFIAALKRLTSAATISIEHEDRRLTPEASVATSADLLAAFL